MLSTGNAGGWCSDNAKLRVDINAAVSSPLVLAGDVINVEPGTYDNASLPGFTVPITKSLNLQGGKTRDAGQLPGPSIIDSDAIGLTITASNVAR